MTLFMNDTLILLWDRGDLFIYFSFIEPLINILFLPGCRNKNDRMEKILFPNISRII